MAAQKLKKYICLCYYSRNIYVKKYKLHVTYEDDEQFWDQCRQDLRHKGCATDEQFQDVLQEVKEEVARRRSFHQAAFDRHRHIQEHYVKLHPHIWELSQSLIDSRLPKLINSIEEDGHESFTNFLLEHGGSVHDNNLYSLPVFSEKFCQQLIEEIQHFEDSSLPKGRPNTMSKHAVSMDELGLSESLITSLIVKYFRPLAGVLFPAWGGSTIDSFKAFVVHYGPDKDVLLTRHFDNAEVTMNICLNKGYEGGDLVFGGLSGDQSTAEVVLHHELGSGIIHCGRQLHEALPITSGDRYNLIVWMRSSAIRNQCCPMCGDVPKLAEVPFAEEGYIKADPEAVEGSCKLV